MKRKILVISLLLILAVTLAFALTAGPNFPTAATGNTNTVGAGTLAWTTPTNIGAADSVFTTATSSGTLSQTTDDLIGTGFGFAIASTDTINGITLEVNYKLSLAGSGVESHVRLLKAGTAAGGDKSTGAAIPTTAATVTYGGAADLWSTTWTPSDINNATFGALTTYTSTATRTFSVDFFRITVTSTPGTTPASGFLKMFGFNSRPPLPHTQTRTFGYDDRKR